MNTCGYIMSTYNYYFLFDYYKINRSPLHPLSRKMLKTHQWYPPSLSFAIPNRLITFSQLVGGDYYNMSDFLFLLSRMLFRYWSDHMYRRLAKCYLTKTEHINELKIKTNSWNISKLSEIDIENITFLWYYGIP